MEIFAWIVNILFYIPMHTPSLKFGSFTISNIWVCVVISSVLLALLAKYRLGKKPFIKSSINFHQELAKSNVKWLNFIFCCVILLIFWTTYALTDLILALSNDKYQLDIEYLGYKNSFVNTNSLALIVAFLMAFVAIGAYFYKTKIDKFSINSLAKILDADEISIQTAQKNSEKILLNIIEEMAIASHVKMPRVFIMHKEGGVNAMCSGENFGDLDERVAIFVTLGALKTFNRDELQAVIGHEFSHAYHGDVRLNIKLISVVFALDFISLIGARILRSVRNSGNSKNKGQIVLIALVFYVMGIIGAFFAQLISSAISREKEYLADISSVKYTRNPNAMAQALSKLLMIQKFGKTYDDGIYFKDTDAMKKEWKNGTKKPNLKDYFFNKKSAAQTYNAKNNDTSWLNSSKNFSKIDNIKARQCAHMFFLPAFSGLFASHPPLDKRIKKVKSILNE